MILSDSNIFIIDRFFPRDVRYVANKRFVERLPELECATSIYSLLEVCGLASFNLSQAELAEWFLHFDQVYAVEVLFPQNVAGRSAARFWDEFLDTVFRLMSQKMTFLDAAILSTAEEHGATHLVTWNKKDFMGRTSIQVVSPEELVAPDGM
ncbi:MAG: PIN domain-containing protein [Chloroflexi bacterium]|nr:PIN domain-containing protein [Chloroflexota bacterium]